AEADIGGDLPPPEGEDSRHDRGSSTFQACFNRDTGVRSGRGDFAMVGRRTVRRPLMASLAAGLGVGLLFSVGLLSSSTRAAGPGGASGRREGGWRKGAALSFDFVDPALVLDPPTSDAPSLVAATWGVADATCAMLFRYPVSTPPVVRYDLVPEVAAGYPAVSRDGKTYTFTIRKGFRFSSSG